MSLQAPDFGARLSLAMKVLNISRGALASEARADKSLVSRWTRGVVAPRGHNLAVLTEVVRARQPDFTQLSWELPIERFAAAIGAPPAWIAAPAPPLAEVAPPPPSRTPTVVEAAPVPGLPDLPYGVVALCRQETEVRGAAYEGHFRAFVLSATRLGEIMRLSAMLRLRGDILEIRLVGGGWECRGWMMSRRAQLHGLMSDAADGGIAYLLLNGVTMPRALAMDGIFTTTAHDKGQTPVSSPILFERIDSLGADPETDDERVEVAKRAAIQLDPAEVPSHVRAFLFRDFGPTAHAAGGDPMLRIDWRASLAQGGTMADERPA